MKWFTTARWRSCWAGLPALVLVAACTAAPPAQPEASKASLVNTYWKLLRLHGQPVEVAEGQREPYLLLQIEQQRVVGFSGCNRLAGSYRLDGERLGFGAMLGTRMACAEGMGLERRLLDILPTVTRWKINGEQLQLLDDSGIVLALLESRYMN